MVSMNFNFQAKASDDADAMTQDISATVTCTTDQLIVFAGRATAFLRLRARGLPAR